MKLYQFPLIKTTLWFIVGIGCANYLSLTIIPIICLLIVTLILALWGHYLSQKNLENNILFSIAIIGTYLFTGIGVAKIHNETLQKNHFTHFNYQKNSFLKIHIVERLKSSEKHLRYIAELQKIDDQKTNGKILLNLKKEKKDDQLFIGQVLLTNGIILNHFKTSNPNQFDYGNYLNNKNIYGQLFVALDNIKILPEPIRDFRFYTDQFRLRIQKNLAKSYFPEKELAVVNALILGQQQDIDRETLKNYQYTGVVHILSVSGLHVGILLIFLNYMLTYLPTNRFGHYSKLLLTLIGLWSFALVAGLAPSVVRATVMFSCLAIGMHLKRTTNIYNTTAASILIILLFEPNFLFDIGFQLSYLAVFSIISIEPILASFYKPKHKITRFIWKLFTVSVSAQLGTLPLSLYYFHQFPSLFFIANLIIIPLLEFIIMPLGVIVVILGYFDVIPETLANGLAKSIQLMNHIISKLASFDTFLITKIPFSIALLVLAYLLIVILFKWLSKPKFQTALLSLILLVSFQIVWVHKHISLNKEDLIVFNAKKHTIIAQQKKNQLTIYSDTIIQEESFENHMINDYAIANFKEINTRKALPNVLFHQHKRIFVLDHPKIHPPTKTFDILIICHSPKINLERFFKKYQPKLVIVDASNYKTFVHSCKTLCTKLKIPFHSTYEKGFYRL